MRVIGVHPLEDAYLEQIARSRAAAALALTFAAIAVVGATGGLFTVLTYAIHRRRREFGIRSAMGASPAQLQRFVLGDGALLAFAGLAVSVGPSWVVARALRSLEYGISTTDPVTWTLVMIVLAFATMLASWRPARQAMYSDPALLLREE